MNEDVEFSIEYGPNYCKASRVYSRIMFTFTNEKKEDVKFTFYFTDREQRESFKKFIEYLFGESDHTQEIKFND